MKYLRISFYLVFVSVLIAPVKSIGQSTLANELFSNFEFSKTIEYFNKNNIQEDDFESLYMLGLSYYFIHDYKNAEPILKKLVKQENPDPQLFLYLANTFKNNQKFDEANYPLKEYAKFDKCMASHVRTSIDSIQHWNTLEPKYSSYKIENANSTGADFSPFVFDNQIIYAVENTGNPETDLLISQYSESTGKLNYGFEIDPGVHYYLAKIIDGKRVESSNKINLPKELLYRNNAVCFDKVNSKLYITRIFISENPDVKTKSAIYVAGFNPKTNTIGELKPVIFHDTLTNFNFGHAFITEDGSTMYFASDMPGGKGGYDIYESKMKNGSWGHPKNLGSSINGNKNEMFPYLKNNELYFASNSFEGYGGLDIFKSIGQNNTWSRAENLQAPINTSADDFGFVFIDDKKGLYCSNRFGGNGDDDIYGFERIIKEEPAEPEPEPVDSFTIIKDLAFENILFEFNSSELSNGYKSKLDSLYKILQERSETMIGLYGYTDVQGRRNYNLNLSAERSKAVYDYMIEKGLEPDKIINKAKGEGSIKLTCKTDSCLEVQNRLNRRVEIVFNPRFNYSGVIESHLFNIEKDRKKLKDEELKKLEDVVSVLQSDSMIGVRLIAYSDTLNTIPEAQKRISLIERTLQKNKISEEIIFNEVDCYLHNSKEIDFDKVELILFREE